MTLPAPVAAYLTASNLHDVDAMIAPFSATATVKDEGQERQGTAAIREWMEEATRNYQPTVEVLGVTGTDDRTVVTGRVSGTFPGSPVDLRYTFTVADEKISRLEIT
jgi:hypothetical protein